MKTNVEKRLLIPRQDTSRLAARYVISWLTIQTFAIGQRTAQTRPALSNWKQRASPPLWRHKDISRRPRTHLWACATQHPPISDWSFPITGVTPIITTAKVPNVGALLVRVPVHNPRTFFPYGGRHRSGLRLERMHPLEQNASSLGKHRTIHARAHLPLVAASIAQTGWSTGKYCG